MDGIMQEARELQSECAEDIMAVEGRLAAIYIEARVDLLNDMLEEYFEEDGTDWSQAALPTGLRDCCFEIVNTLVLIIDCSLNLKSQSKICRRPSVNATRFKA